MVDLEADLAVGKGMKKIPIWEERTVKLVEKGRQYKELAECELLHRAEMLEATGKIDSTLTMLRKTVEELENEDRVRCLYSGQPRVALCSCPGLLGQSWKTLPCSESRWRKHSSRTEP